MTKFLLLMNHDGGTSTTTMHEWSEEDRKAHLDHLTATLDTLRERGELVDGAGPDLAGARQGGRGRRGDGAGGHRRAVRRGQGVPGRLPDRRRRVRGAGARDRRAGLGRARAGRACRWSSRSRCAGDGATPTSGTL